jgi:hypothetical protein
MKTEKPKRIDNRKSVKLTTEVHEIFVKYCEKNNLNYRKFLDSIILEKCKEN